MSDTNLYCLVCGNEARSLGEDPGGIVHRISIPSCVTSEGYTRIIYVCIRCADDLRNFLTNIRIQMDRRPKTLHYGRVPFSVATPWLVAHYTDLSILETFFSFPSHGTFG
jgi:hypothetical protein